MHPNAIGHRIAAEVIYNWLRSRLSQKSVKLLAVIGRLMSRNVNLSPGRGRTRSQQPVFLSWLDFGVRPA